MRHAERLVKHSVSIRDRRVNVEVMTYQPPRRGTFPHSVRRVIPPLAIRRSDTQLSHMKNIQKYSYIAYEKLFNYLYFT